MSHAIALPAASRRQAAAFAALRMLMLSLLMLLSHGAWADPAAANQALTVSKQNFALLKQNYTVAKMQVQAGQPNAAIVSFTLAKAQAAQMGSNLIRLLNENKHSLENGLYLNHSAQENAVQYSSIAKNSAQLLQTRLAILSIQPGSQVDLIMADQALAKLTFDMTRLEQEMIAAQQ
ncbi:hypothetical protein [Pseudomonas sp. CGJS7]|uniref:hypothetical protein n=1 Tax=Pseudomonas sp. CGJS7 TaxID=3109348 RepID=UPI003008EFC0